MKATVNILVFTVVDGLKDILPTRSTTYKPILYVGAGQGTIS
jgi:hypothetical protein